MIVIVIIIAFIIAWGLTQHFCNPDSNLHILDHPNERSLHIQPIPRSGGIAILASLLAAGIILLLFYPDESRLIILLLCALPLAAVSFLDDCSGVRPEMRLLTHILAAIILISEGYRLDTIKLLSITWTPSPWLAIFLSLGFIVWMINLYNFMDGMDGFAGGMTVIGFSSFAILGWQAGNVSFTQISLLIAGAAAGFLWFNFPPARIFLGDTGSSVLGFLAAALSLWGSQDGLFPLWVTVLIFSPFIVDATITLLRRILKGEKIWLPHKTHYYQRLVQLGWGHRKTVLMEYLLMLACSISALLARYLSSGWQAGLLVTWILIYSVLMVRVNYLERQTTGQAG